VTRILIVTAVEAERAAVLRGLTPGFEADGAEASRAEAHGTDTHVDVLVGGVGPAAAAAATAVALSVARAHGRAYDIVVSMGIGGAFAGRAAIGDIVAATASIAADLGAQSPDGFLSVTDLGFGQNMHAADVPFVNALGARGALLGSIMTVSTVTGSAERAAELAAAHPDALVEAMEGYGVACAAAATGTRFAEVRTISNLVGPRDRSAWRIGDALAALSVAAGTVGTLSG
jgi:futalosine hydrolase